MIFATKYRAPLIPAKIEKHIYDHMREQLIEQGCPVAMINGMPDHVHLLFLQNPLRAVTDVIKQVKGNTSFWINQQRLIPEKFAWQTGFAAYSVGDPQVDKVVNYIRNQKLHHSGVTFEKEFEELNTQHRIAANGPSMEL